ncbi:MAG TPA: cache domain-containing protein [Deltaproteobacteria bacterium]|jgi:signal transduction histidine kinase|nr:cache domain-containing protein [Deltaproteobacteria bacterium]HOI08663.1 cache domain-containing protein [Deltaproteobacteria bacterium]
MSKGKVFGAAAALVFWVLAITASSFADDAAKRKVLMDGVNYGVKVIENKGKAALDELKSYRFGDGTGYVYVTDMSAVVLMHPVAPELVGKDCTAIKDAAGKYFGAEMKHKAHKTGSGWASYLWPNPAKNKQPELKCSYFKSANMGGTKVIVYAADFGISEAGCN